MKTCNLLNLALLLGLLVGSVPNRTLAQNCGCAPGYCCSNYGYCGTTPDYCDQLNCKENCPSNNNGVTVSTVVTPEFFDAILAQSGQTSCPGNGFYTRDNFLGAANQFPQFGTSGASDDSLREIAAFFAHVTHETGHMCYIEERPKPPGSELPTFCKSSNTQYPCNPNKKYYGRGPLQLTWNYNYGLAGDALKFDGLNYPETLATDALFSFKASVWFWMTNVHSTIVSGQGFGATIRAINSNECDARDPQTVESRVNYYLDYCKKFGVSPGNNLSC